METHTPNLHRTHLRENYLPKRLSTLYLNDENGKLYLWTNIAIDCFRFDDTRKEVDWYWRLVSSGQYDLIGTPYPYGNDTFQHTTWVLPFLQDHVPAVFAVVAKN